MTQEQEIEYKKLQKKCKDDEEVSVMVRSSNPKEIQFSIVKKS